MTESRRKFLDRINAYQSATEAQITFNREPSARDHNSRARILRSGLSVVGFSILESFVNKRSSEILKRVGNSPIRFDSLPEKLRRATTQGVIDALNFQISVRSSNIDDVTSFIQRHAQLVASTSSTGYQLSELALGASKSNLSHEDIKQILRVFRVKDAWGKINNIASRAGLGEPSLRDAYKGATRRRHKGAHQAGADIEPTDLQFYHRQAIGIALGFDGLISRGLKFILDADSEFISGEKWVDEYSDITLRFINYSPDGFREEKEGNDRATKISENIDSAKSNAFGRAKRNDEMLVVRDENKLPVGWYTPYID